MIRHSLLVLALVTSTASAQPGATPPSESAPPAGQPLPPIATIDENGQLDINVDSAIAQVEASLPTIESVAAGAFRRARRSVSVGPTVGAWGTGIIDGGDIDGALTFGIGIEKFKVPVLPSMQTVKALITERVKAQVKDRIKAAFMGRPVEPIELNALVAQVYTEVRDEILGLSNVRAKTLERPHLTLALEANRVFGAERWLGRTRVGVGVWKVTLAASLAVGGVCRGGTCDDGVKVFVGPEVVVHLLTSKNPRASVLDVFVRFDFQTNSRGTEVYDQVALGARYLLDLF